MTLGPGLIGVHGERKRLPATLNYSDFMSQGARHRKQRKMINPVFSIKHMREMTPIFYDIAHRVGPLFEPA